MNLVRVVGLRDGREWDALLDVARDRRTLTFGAPPDAGLVVALDDLDGWHAARQSVTLYLTGGDVLDVTAADDSAREVVRLALDAAAMVPELTRSLRYLGAASAADASLHDRWFAPFLRVRAALDGVSDPLRQAALVDVDRLHEEVARTLEQLAVVRAGGDPPRARAIEAELEDDTLGVPQALARLAIATSTLAGSAPDSRLADWRQWVAALAALARAFDDAWPAVRRIAG